MTAEYVIPVPGRFRDHVAYLDLETVKVPTPSGFIMSNGERLRQRWSIAMYGVAIDGDVRISANLSEMQNVVGLGSILSSLDHVVDEVVYAATREFDEMIAKGRFTNARRAHEPAPFFPPVPGAEMLPWRNLRKIPKWIIEERSGDFESKDVPAYLAAGRHEEVMVHLMRDVVNLILADGNPDKRCSKWCHRVLGNYPYAHAEIFRGK